jgi:hypothetical protein
MGDKQRHGLSTESEPMSGSRHHTVKAALGIGASFVFLFIPLAGIYLDPKGKLIWLWVLLFFSTIPAVGWGASHLARARGYPSATGSTICVIGYFVAAFLGTTLRHPLVFALGIVFITLLPVVVLFALPSKNRPRRKRHYEEQVYEEIDR